MIKPLPSIEARGHSGRTSAGRRRSFGGPLGALFTVVAALAILIGGVAWASGYVEYAAWWLTNRTSPSVAIMAPSGVVRGMISVALDAMPHERVQVIGAELDDQAIAAAVPLVIDTSALADGSHRLSVTVQDTSWARNRARADAVIVTDNTPPRLSLNGAPDVVQQGGTWLLLVRANEPATVSARISDAPLDLQPADGYAWAVIGISAEHGPGDLPLVVDGIDVAGNRAEQRLMVRITAGSFDHERVTVPERLLPLLRPEVRADEDARLALIYATLSQDRLWDGPLILPVQGEVVTRFGEVRSYNGNPFEGHHAGIDIAAPSGRPVVAPARGRVVFVGSEPVRGNVLVLDHGLGVFTTYAHLAVADVQVGQVVEQGQSIARVGSTGLSEGPHLHWELWVHQVNVDPVEWTRRSLP